MPPSSIKEIELDRLVASTLEQADAVTGQDGSNVDDDLVEESVLQALPGDVRAEDDNVAVAGRLLGDGHRLLDADVQETSGDALDDGRIGRRVVSRHEERSSERAAIEPGLQAIPYVLRSAADEERAGGADNCIDRLTRSGVHPEYPAHVLVRSCDEAVEASSSCARAACPYRTPVSVAYVVS